MKKANKENEETKGLQEKPFAETLPDLGEYAVLNLKVLHTTFENYFYVWMPKEIPIDEDIERNKDLQEMKIVSNLKAAKEAGKKTTIVYNAEKITRENLDVLYAVKLKTYLKEVDFSIENDFIEDELKKCSLWFDKMPEKKLMKRWIEFLENKLSIQIQHSKPVAKTYLTFNKLFEDATWHEAFGEIKNNNVYLAKQSRYNSAFHIWLHENKNWNYDNEEQYQTLLTKENFIEFLKSEQEQQHMKSKDFENEKQSWQLQPQKDNPKKDAIEFIIKRTELYSFLSVPAPDVLHKNAFWHDENDKPIDCNIYHFRYGYKGFEAATKDVIASFNPVTVYQNEETGKYIYCLYYLPMLCTADEINFTNKDGKKIIIVNYLQTHQIRLAENEQDFELIYNREFESKKLIDTPETRKVFYQELINHVNELIALHKERSTYKNRDITTLSLADKFIVYLNNLTAE